MTDFIPVVQAYQFEDLSWDYTPPEGGFVQNGTLDISKFDATTHYPNGFIKSGCLLGRVTSGGLLGPYSGRAAEVQTVNLGAASAGTITLTFDGATTGNIAFNAAASAVQTALEGLPNVNPGDVTCSGGALPATVNVTFGGQYAGKDVPQMTGTPTGLTGGTITIGTSTAGGTSVVDGRQTAVGVLRVSVPVTHLIGGGNRTKIGVAYLVHGIVSAAALPYTVGSQPLGGYLDAGARADLPLIYWAA